MTQCPQKPIPRCETCRTINLAGVIADGHPSHDGPQDCAKAHVCATVPELQLKPVCIKVCTKEEYWRRLRGIKPKPAPLPHIGHGKLMYLVKTGILAGALYWTVHQGVWGDQRDVTEAIRRWQEYIHSINTRVPPTFDKCGNVVLGERDSLIGPIYQIYKLMVTSIFSGVAKFPTIIKCMYINYISALAKRDEKK